MGWNSKHVWEALTPKKHDSPRHPLTWISWLCNPEK